MTREKHEVRLEIRLTQAEHASLEKAADRYGMTLSAVLRFLLREHEKKEADDADTRASWRGAREPE